MIDDSWRWPHRNQDTIPPLCNCKINEVRARIGYHILFILLRRQHHHIASYDRSSTPSGPYCWWLLLLDTLPKFSRLGTSTILRSSLTDPPNSSTTAKSPSLLYSMTSLIDLRNGHQITLHEEEPFILGRGNPDHLEILNPHVSRKQGRATWTINIMHHQRVSFHLGSANKFIGGWPMLYREGVY